MSPLIRRLLRAAFYLASVLVGALSLTPSTTLPPVSIGDKAEHVIAYALLGLLGGISSERSVVRTAFGLAAFGIAIELLQAFSPGRSPDVFDVLADIVGACIGCGGAIALRRMALTADRPRAASSDADGI
ncbi:VanZ family protein [Dongia deserti]|uniref:VanZ family protein n=1 Tax=Dongia deserti TaxID=2268030 RepID=UPI000E64DEF1|nr:VanZ family protein [Dongia deserti]